MSGEYLLVCVWGCGVGSIDKSLKNCSNFLGRISGYSFNRERFFGDLFTGKLFFGDLFSWKFFSGESFSPQPFFRGFFFSGTFDLRIFFPGTSALGFVKWTGPNKHPKWKFTQARYCASTPPVLAQY